MGVILSQDISQPEPEPVTDESLMLSYAQGQVNAFELLYSKHKGGLYRYFVRQIGDKQLAEDLYQETWGRVIRSAQQYKVTAKFTTWLYRIAHNLLIDHVRAVKPLDAVEDIDVALSQSEGTLGGHGCNEGDMEAQFILQRKSLLFKLCIGLLPQVQKEALLLNVETGLTAKVISEVVDASLEATKSRLRYAHISLKECVSSKWQEDSDD